MSKQDCYLTKNERLFAAMLGNEEADSADYISPTEMHGTAVCVLCPVCKGTGRVEVNDNGKTLTSGCANCRSSRGYVYRYRYRSNNHDSN